MSALWAYYYKNNETRVLQLHDHVMIYEQSQGLQIGSRVMNDTNQRTPTDEQKAANRARFELELEFVQSLANPFYLQSLAQQNIFEQPAFINFLEYLMYWKEKDYARFIQYAHFLNRWYDVPHGMSCQLSTCSSSSGALAACPVSI